LDACLEIIADLIGVVRVQLVLTPEKHRDLRGLDRVNGSAHEGLVDWLQVHLFPED
jgi:hypothetical protein